MTFWLSHWGFHQPKHDWRMWENSLELWYYQLSYESTNLSTLFARTFLFSCFPMFSIQMPRMGVLLHSCVEGRCLFGLIKLIEHHLFVGDWGLFLPPCLPMFKMIQKGTVQGKQKTWYLWIRLFSDQTVSAGDLDSKWIKGNKSLESTESTSSGTSFWSGQHSFFWSTAMSPFLPIKPSKKNVKTHKTTYVHRQTIMLHVFFLFSIPICSCLFII
jgi:hypothetical protein